jgi:hypothetical protein
MLPTPRMRSPKGSVSPRAHLSNVDLLCAGFLRNFKNIVLVTVSIAFIRLVVMPSTGPLLPEFQSSVHSDNDSSSSSSSIIKSPIILPSIWEAKPQEYKSGDQPDEDDDTLKSESADITPTLPMDHDVATTQSSKSVDHHRNSNDTTNRSSTATPKNNASSNDFLRLYNASLSPVIPGGVQGLLQVHLVVDITSESGNADPSSKFLLSAIQRSKFLKAVGVTFVRRLPPLLTEELHPWDPSLPLLFLIDWGSLERDCHRLQLVMERIQEEYQRENNNSNNNNNKNNSNKTSQTSILPPVSLLQEPYTLLVDFTGSTRQTQCEYLFQDSYFQDKTRVRLAKRSIVQGRFYNHDTSEIHLGQILSPLGWHTNDEIPILYSPLILRESFVNAIVNATLGAKVHTTERPTDVGFFWNNGDFIHYAFYRRDIAKLVKTLHHSKITSKIVMKNEVDLVYTDVKGYNVGNVQFDYVTRLLGCKIVVVTQRDEWEDQYRLMESLASGALVMTDEMLAMPGGLVDKLNVVIYDSPQTLKKLIRYYLHPNHEQERKRIALEGYRLVMGRHRCWHRLEELIYGQPLTNAYKPYDIAPKKDERSENAIWVDADGDLFDQFL